MKLCKVTFWIVFMLIVNGVKAQSVDQYPDIINQSLMKYVEITEKTFIDKKSSLVNDFPDTYLLNQGYPYGYEFSKEIKDHFKFIDLRDNKRNLKKLLKKSISVIVYIGPKLIDGNIKIILGYRSVSFKQNSVNFVNGGRGIELIWKYSSELNKWELINVNEKGI